MPDPREWPPRGALRWLTAGALAATLALSAALALHDRPLRPYSIVSLELAWTSAQAAALLAAWGAAGQRVAREALWLDFAYMPAYALLAAGLVVLEARRSRGAVQRAGVRLAAAPFAAWLLDVVENLALLRVLAAPAAPPAGLLIVAGLSASVKFLLLLACGLYVIFALVLRLAVWLSLRRARAGG
jgi:hypothetical protein